MAGTGLKPTITVTTEQNGRTGCMVEYILFNNCLLRRAEQGTTGTVITDYVVCKINFRSPLQILDTECSFLTDSRIDRFLKKNKNFSIVLEKQLLPYIDSSDGFYFCVLQRFQ